MSPPRSGAGSPFDRASVSAAHEVVRTTCPRDCYDACGILVVRREGERSQVRGDPEHPVSRGKLCRKCSIAYNGVFLDAQARLTTPLIRTGPKGSGTFREATWDEAISLVAARLGSILERHGGSAVAYAHYTGTFSMLAYHQPCRLMRRIGALEVDPDTVCNNAGHRALEYVYGSSLEGFDPRTSEDSDCVLVWGCNPSATAPHMQEHWLEPQRGTVIVVDPIRTDSAKAADIHLQPRPGTDAALAFAMLHVIFAEGLADRAFLGEHVLGGDELEAASAACTPEWGEQATGVPAESLRAAARIYAAGRSLLWIGQGLQRQPTGGNTVRSVAMLPAVTGNLSRAGSGFLYLNGAENRQLDEGYLSGAEAFPEVPAPISHMELAAHLEDRTRAHALVCFNINIAASNPDQARLHAALRRADLFTVVADLFPTDSTDYADVVLPAASFLEFDDVVASYFHRSISAQVRALEPPGLALTNMEIFRRLAAAMGLEDAVLHESDETIIETLMARRGVELSFAELAQAGTIWPSLEPEIQFEGCAFPTPSGRVEVLSEAAERDGHGRLPRPHADSSPSGARLRLLSPATAWMMNASFANEPKIERRAGALTVFVHPDEALSRGLVDRAQVLVKSETGELGAVLAVTDDVPLGVAYLPKGRWPKREPGGANVNVLTASRASDMGRSATFHGTEVTLRASPVR
jgi:anaerobic selenocysteine-containing dehydrogenase